MKLPIRFFSIGLFTAAVLILIVYTVFDKPGNATDNIPVEDLISTLESEGYRTITKDEFISYSLYLDTQKEEQEKEQKQEKEAKKKERNEKDNSNKKDDKIEKKNNEDKNTDEKEVKDEPKKLTLSINQGDVSQDIANNLKDNGIIDDAQKFSSYLEDNDYSSYIQIGKFEVNSAMNHKEIAEIITTYPGN